MSAGPQIRFSPERRRAQILDAAGAVIAAKGLTDLNVRDVAATAGVSVGTVTHHFSGIKEILDGVLEIHSDRFQARIAETLADRTSALDGLVRLIDVVLSDEPRTRDESSLWLASCARAPYEDDLARWLTGRYEAWRGNVRDMLEEAMRQGEIEEVDPESTSLELVALIDGYVVAWLIGDAGLTPATAREAVERALLDRLPVLAKP